MDKHELDSKIEEIAKTLLSYCTARTSDHFEAEDLAQDIIVEIYKSADKIRNIDAIYGFMWGIAGNVYKQWCKKKAKGKECELTDTLPDITEIPPEEDQLPCLLRRELALLSQKYRQAVILYYIENKSCSEISAHLSISESRVKYLLFKSRQILKEGMSMERNYGSQSYNPKRLQLLFWGHGSNRYYHLCDNKISQNILFACYNDRLTAEQVSLEIGVALPYMEDKLNELCEYDLLKKDGNRYYTNIVIFTREFMNEVNVKTADTRERIADLLAKAVTEHEKEVRDIDFYGCDMNRNSFAWQMVSFILFNAVIVELQNRVQIEYPVDKFGTRCFVWGSENKNAKELDFFFGISNAKNSEGHHIQFMDYPINGDMVHHYFSRESITNVFLDIANGNTDHFSENDKALAADMVRKGYVVSNEKGLSANVPIFTWDQYQTLRDIFAEAAARIADEAEKLIDEVAAIMKNHIPVHLKKFAHDMAYLRLFDDAISAPAAILYDRGFMYKYSGDGMLPTTYVIL